MLPELAVVKREQAPVADYEYRVLAEGLERAHKNLVEPCGNESVN